MGNYFDMPGLAMLSKVLLGGYQMGQVAGRQNNSRPLGNLRL